MVRDLSPAEHEWFDLLNERFDRLDEMIFRAGMALADGTLRLDEAATTINNAADQGIYLCGLLIDWRTQREAPEMIEALEQYLGKRQGDGGGSGS